ncbi:MAG: class I SAM-dependent methyltransferase [Polyangiaceae bacterium]|nr:class I SAM-dependent methyltransferase [Polyangiaceae bacterium]MCW5792112.1 class I SAM-dependent methyltransferase [Polyangiaceae bacterium]
MDLYAAPRLYAQLFGAREHDVALYRWLAQGLPEGEPVLELGVGSGRVALALAADGVPVIGVDRAVPMLEALASQARVLGVGDRLQTLHADIQALELPRRFSLISFPFNGLAHADDAAALHAVLSAVARHLAEGGVFAFDVLRLAPHHLDSEHHTPYFEHPETGVPCRVIERARYHAAIQRLEVSVELRPMRGSQPNEQWTLSLRLFEPPELTRALSAVGLRVTNQVDLGDSDALICKAK